MSTGLLASAYYRAFRAQWVRRLEKGSLLALDDHLLEDIGLRRAGAVYYSSHGQGRCRHDDQRR